MVGDTKASESLEPPIQDQLESLKVELLQRMQELENSKRETTAALEEARAVKMQAEKDLDEARKAAAHNRQTLSKSWQMDTLTRVLPQTFLTRPLIFTTKVILLISNNIYHTTLIRKGLAGMEPSKSLKVLSTQNFRG